MNRREARECAFSLLFQLDFWSNEDINNQIELFFNEHPEKINQKSIDFIKLEVLQTYNNKETIDNIISKYVKDWTIDRIAKVDLSILRLATYEMLYDESIPVGVSVNEAVELSKKYSSDESPSFVNGILNKIAKELDK